MVKPTKQLEKLLQELEDLAEQQLDAIEKVKRIYKHNNQHYKERVPTRTYDNKKTDIAY